MADRVFEFFRSISTWRRATTMLVVTITLFLAYLQYIVPLEEMGGGAAHLDIRYGVGYSHADVIAYFDRLGPQGRAFYVKTTLFDTIWPLCIAVCGALWAPLAFKSKWPVIAAAFCPVMFGILDLFENIGLWTMLAQYPDVSSDVAAVGNAITLTKQAMIPGWLLTVPGLPVIAVLRRHMDI